MSADRPVNDQDRVRRYARTTGEQVLEYLKSFPAEQLLPKDDPIKSIVARTADGIYEVTTIVERHGSAAYPRLSEPQVAAEQSATDRPSIPPPHWTPLHYAIWNRSLPDQVRTRQQLCEASGRPDNKWTFAAITLLVQHGCLIRRRRNQYLRGHSPHQSEDSQNPA